MTRPTATTARPPVDRIAGVPLIHPANQGRLAEVQQARWEAVQQAREQGLSLRAIARNLAMAKNTAKKYASAESPPTKKLSAKERAKAEAGAGSPTSAD